MAVNILDALASVVFPAWPQLKRMGQEDELNKQVMQRQGDADAANERVTIMQSYPEARVSEIDYSTPSNWGPHTTEVPMPQPRPQAQEASPWMPDYLKNPDEQPIPQTEQKTVWSGTPDYREVPLKDSASFKDASWDALSKGGKLQDALLAQQPKVDTEKNMFDFAQSMIANANNPQMVADIMSGLPEDSPFLQQAGSLSRTSAETAKPFLQNISNSMNMSKQGSTMQMAAQLRAENPNMTWADAISIAKSGLGQGRTVADGVVKPMPGATDTAGAFKGAEATATKQVELEYNPKIAGLTEKAQQREQVSSSLEKEYGKKEGERLSVMRTKADDAEVALSIIDEGRSLIDKGLYTGSAANIKLGFDKWLQEAGISIGGEKAATTEAYAGIMGKMVGKVIKDFGSGTGLSDADREYAEKIAAGKITLTSGTLKKMLDINERLAMADIRRFNREVGKARKASSEGSPLREAKEPKSAPQTQEGDSGPTIMVIRPDGEQGTIPANRWLDASKKGFKRMK